MKFSRLHILLSRDIMLEVGIHSGDYAAAHGLLDAKSRAATSFQAYTQYWALEGSLRSVRSYSYKPYSEAENTVIYAVTNGYEEKTAYAAAYSPSGPYQPIVLNNEGGEWRVAFPFDDEAIKAELLKYDIDQNQDKGKSAAEFMGMLDEQIPLLMGQYGIPAALPY